MTEELYPESPTALNMSQRRTQTIRGHRFKLLKAAASDPDEIQLTTRSSPNPHEHKLFRNDDESSDDDEINSVQDGQLDRPNVSYLGATPHIKRFKQDTGDSDDGEDGLMRKRKLNYESDESIRHSILDSDSTDDEPSFFHFQQDNRIENDRRPKAPVEVKLDMSVGSKLAENLQELTQYYESQKAEKALELMVAERHTPEQDVEDEMHSSEFQVPPSQDVRQGSNLDDPFLSNPLQSNEEATVDHNNDVATDKDMKVDHDKQLNLFEDTPPADGERDPSIFGEIPKGAYLGFQTAAGVKLPAVDVDDQLDLFGDSQSDDENDNLLKTAAEEFSQRNVTISAMPVEIPELVGFTTADGKNLFMLSKEEAKQAKDWERQLDRAAPKVLMDREEKDNDDGTGVSVAYLEKLNAIERAKKVTFASPRPPKFRPQVSTPIARPRPTEPTLSQEITATVNAVMQDSQFLDERLFFRDLSDSSFGKTFGSRVAFSPIAKPTGPTKTQRTGTQMDQSRRNMLKSQVTEDMKGQRKVLMQLLEANQKSRDLCKPFKSAFIEQKLTSTKVQLKDVLGTKLVPGMLPSGFTLNDIRMDTLLDHKFDTLALLSNDQIRHGFANGVPVDHFLVPLTDTFVIGFKELQLAFFSSKGIDPKLISHEWFLNAYKLILWKLFSMEVYSNAEIAGEWLTARNVLNELHYRYYLEIDCSKQSILKNCLEMDENPGYLMVLFVMDILQNDTLILSDGHYSVKTRIDEFLEEQLEKGRIQRGVKLIIDSAEFVGLDQGYEPLEVPDFVSLKIFGNSTRRCQWDTKLGRFYQRTRLKVSLNGVHPKGGLISAVSGIVVRKYPLLFVSGNRHRNERMQRRYKKELETRHFNLFEKLFHQTEQELVEEEREMWECIDLNRLENISEINDLQELHYLLQASTDPQYLEDQLTASQKRRLDEFTEKARVERTEKVHQRVKEKMNEDLSNESSLLRIKVAAGSSDTDRCAELWIWNPGEELERILTEGRAILMENIFATGTRNHILQLKTGRRTVIKQLPSKAPLASTLTRNLTRLADIRNIRDFSPMFGEFDCVVIILKISRRVSEKFQHVLATDNENNLICLNFWNSLQEFAYEDLVSPGNVISFSNLQWRKNSNTFAIPNAYVTELSVLTMSPGQIQHEEERAKYAEFIECHGLDEIEQNIAARYPFFKDIKSDHSSSLNLNPSDFNASVNQTPLLKTPLQKTRSVPMMTMATPVTSALHTPLIERKVVKEKWWIN